MFCSVGRSYPSGEEGRVKMQVFGKFEFRIGGKSSTLSDEHW